MLTEKLLRQLQVFFSKRSWAFFPSHIRNAFVCQRCCNSCSTVRRYIAGIVRHYYENELDQKEPGTEFQEWLVELFTKLHNLTENNSIPKSHYLEYGFQKMGKNFSYPVSEKFTTSDNDESLLSE